MASEPLSALSDLMESQVRYATARINGSKMLVPFGIVEAENKRILINVFQALEQDKGLPANRLIRMVKATIRSEHEKRPITLASIFYGAELTPMEGGEGKMALIGWLEEASGKALQITFNFEIQDGCVVLGKRHVTQMRPVLLVNDDKVATMPDVGCGRVEQMDIRPTMTFKCEDNLTLYRLVEVLVYGVIDSQNNDNDWNTVSGLGIDKQRFIFERDSLRAAAILVSLARVHSNDALSMIEDGFWNGLDKVNPSIGRASQVYFGDFLNSDPKEKGNKVFVEFSKRCSDGAEYLELIEFARKTFVIGLKVYRELLKMQGLCEI